MHIQASACPFEILQLHCQTSKHFSTNWKDLVEVQGFVVVMVIATALFCLLVDVSGDLLRRRWFAPTLFSKLRGYSHLA